MRWLSVISCLIMYEIAERISVKTRVSLLDELVEDAEEQVRKIR